MLSTRKILMLFVIFPLVIIQTGCNISFSGRTEMNKIEFIRAVGIDKSPENEDFVRLTIATQSVKSSECGGGQNKTSEILISEGRTVFDAVRNFWNVTEKRPFWGHLEYVLIGEEAAKDGLLKYIDYFSRDPEVRLDLKTYIAHEMSAEQIIIKSNREDKFIFDTIEGIAENQWGHSVYNVVDLIEVMYVLDNKNLSLYIPCVKLTETTIGGHDSDEKKDLKMGGFAIFDGDKLFGYLDEKLGRGLNWLKNEIKSGIIAVSSPQDNCISLEIIESSTKLIPEIVDENITITVKIGVSSNIGGLPASENIFTESILKNLEQQQEQIIKEEIMSVIEYAQKNNLDVFDAADTIFRKHPIKWEDYFQNKWKEFFPKIKFNIVVNSRISRTYDIKQPSRVS